MKIDVSNSCLLNHFHGLHPPLSTWASSSSRAWPWTWTAAWEAWLPPTQTQNLTCQPCQKLCHSSWPCWGPFNNVHGLRVPSCSGASASDKLEGDATDNGEVIIIFLTGFHLALPDIMNSSSSTISSDTMVSRPSIRDEIPAFEIGLFLLSCRGVVGILSCGQDPLRSCVCAPQVCRRE